LYNFYVCDRKIIRASVVTRKRKRTFSSLAPWNLVYLSIDVFSAQNDYPVFQESNGSSLIPNILS
jgi:hypothetical protein